MLDGGIIRPSQSLWGFAVVITKKMDGDHRLFVDFRPLNRLMKAEKRPIQNIEELIGEI